MNKKCFAVIFNTKSSERDLGKLWLKTEDFKHHTTQEIKVSRNKVETEKCVYKLYYSGHLKDCSFRGENFNGAYVCNSLRYNLDKDIMTHLLLSIRSLPVNKEEIVYI